MKLESFALIIFIVLSLLGIYHHELWLDEMQRWLLVRDSSSFADLLHNKRFEGHPSLWYTLLYGVKHLSHNPMVMQLLHSGIALLSAFLILFYAPFEKWMRILLIFGYFPFFEYNLMCANYALVFLGLIVFAILHPKKKIPFWILALVLGLMANSHILGLVASAALFIYAVLETERTKSRGNVLSFIVLYLLFVVVAVFHIIPPTESIDIALMSNIGEPAYWLKSLMAIEKSFIPIPDITEHSIWNTYLSREMLPKALRLLLVIGLIGACAFVLRKQKSVLILFILGVLGNYIFALVFPFNGTRYYGFFFLFFVLCIWLAQNRQGEKVFSRFAKSYIYTLFAIQLLASILFFHWDWKHPFSQAKNAAKYILEHQSGNSFIAVDDYSIAVPLSGYIQAPVYYLADERIGSYVHWNNARQITSTKELEEKLYRLQTSHSDKELWFVTNKSDSIKKAKIGGNSLEFLQKYEGGMFQRNDCDLYILN